MIHKINNWDEAIRIMTGEANRDTPHLVVPLYMPIGAALPIDEALDLLRLDVRENVQTQRAKIVASAIGTMHHPSSVPESKHFLLVYGRVLDDSADDYCCFDATSDELDSALLMNGDGTRHFETELTPKEALTKWIAGFLNWNEKVPGLYRLRYSEIAHS